MNYFLSSFEIALIIMSYRTVDWNSFSHLEVSSVVSIFSILIGILINSARGNMITNDMRHVMERRWVTSR